ncbi:unnamed protein product [Macrosiphum euphorbiae]|uniref:Copper transporter n=1 Tax=Macrosiphum euphorbiae TaxID=13131 RepID=A0AAV0WCF5_9HEMI|nr:unnamed protein product [Macrosiphum euphorbiae]
MDMTMLSDAWYTTFPLDDFNSVLRMICDELMKMTLAAWTLCLVLFSTVSVTGRLSECALNMAIKEPAPKACPRQQTAFKTFYNNRWIRTAYTAIIAMLLLCMYVSTVVRPVYLLVAGSVLSTVGLCGSLIVAVLKMCVRWGKVFL